MVEWKATEEEYEVILKIVNRATENGFTDSKNHRKLCMDLEATHSNGCLLDFDKLLEFNDGEFGHDIHGIQDCLDRTTGKLKNCFVPRCSKTD